MTGNSEARTTPIQFDDFYAETFRRTLLLAYSMTNDWGAAEDLAQDAYMSAHRRWNEIGAFDDPAAWVRKAVVNRARSRWQRISRDVKLLARLGARHAPDAPMTDRHDPEFWKAVRRLPPKQRSVVALHYVEDMSIEAIAQTLGCSTGTVKTHLSRARNTIRDVLTANTPAPSEPSAASPRESDHG